MKVAILIGSIRKGRQSQKAAYLIEKKLEARGVEVDIIDLAENTLPMLEERADRDPQVSPDVIAVGKRLAVADSVILLSPEYHGSYTGVLKNALDYYRAEFQKKPIGVIAVSSGKMAGINASVQMQHLVLSMGAYALPQKFLVPDITNTIDEHGHTEVAALQAQADKFAEEFLWLTQAIVSAKNNQTKKELV